MSSVMTRIEPLGKDNFDTWRLQVEALLIKNDAWGYVSGEKIKPKIIAGNPQSENDVKEWYEGDRKARSDLILAINPSELKQIKNCETSLEVWKKLHTIYQTKGPARKASLLKRLQKMKDGMDIRVHIREFFDAVDKLLDMDIAINDDLLAIMLLYSLPDSCENFRCAIEARDELPTPEALKIKILEEFDSRKSREVEKDQNAMFIGKHANRKAETSYNNTRSISNQKTGTFFKYKCHRCRKIGHMAADCKFKNKQKPKEGETTKICVESKREIALLQMEKEYGSGWCLDSGCTSHMATKRHFFNSIEEIQKPLNLANGDLTKIHGVGEVKLTTSNKEGVQNLKLGNVMYVPDLRTNLLSIAKITDKGYSVNFSKHHAYIQSSEGKVIAVADRKGDLYFLRKVYEKVNLSYEKNEISDWHKKLGHVNVRSMVEMSKRQTVLGLKIPNKQVSLDCKVCVQAKQIQTPFPKREEVRTNDLLEIVHSDICGPMRVNSIGGSRYFAVFIDDKSRWCEVYFLKNKCEVLDAFKNYKSFVETQTGKRIKSLQTDNGLEFCNENFDKFLNANGIRRRLTIPHTPQQNGMAERKNRTLIETARSIMIEAKTPSSFWAEAVNTANYIRNRCPSKSLAGETPYKIWTGKRPNVSHFKVFGCKALALNKDPNLGKFDSRSINCIFLGYCDKSKGYKLWSIDKKKVIVSRDVKFIDDFDSNPGYEEFFDFDTESNDEAKTGNEDLNKSKEDQDSENYLEVILHEPNESSQINVPKNDRNETNLKNNIGEQVTKATKPKRGRPKSIRTGKRGRPRKIRHIELEKPRRPQSHPSRETLPPLNDESSSDTEYESANLAVESDPTNISEALSSGNADEWLAAIQQEYLAHIRNKTWEIIDQPKGKNVIDSKFVFVTKYTARDEIARRKARLVARGFNQQEGIDFQETFAPVMRMTSLRTLVAIAIEKGWKIHQTDVETAYLHGELEEEVYMKLPDMVEESLKQISTKYKNDNDIALTSHSWLSQLNTRTPKVCLLKKSLYGLKQSGRQWYLRLDQELQLLGMKKSISDPCVYTAKKNKDMLIIAIYVDDLLIISGNESWINKTKEDLKKHFKMKDLGDIRYCLGIEFVQSCDGKTMCMYQHKYTQDILRRFKMEECNPVITPLDVNVKLQRAEVVNRNEETYPYQSLIGSLMYLAVSTRPDISYAVSMLSQYNTCYSKEHWLAAKRILRYLKGTANVGLVYRKNGEQICGYADADWGGSIDDRKSYSGYTFKLAGSSISWESRKQRTVALSSTEAEYVALSEATKEAVFLKNFLAELEYCEGQITIFNDNQGAQRIAKNTSYCKRTKHIDIRTHFIREALERKQILLKYMPTQQMPADILTKALPGPKHKDCMKTLGLEDLAARLHS